MQVIEIYALVCPDTMQIRYIGKSKNSRRRFHEHVYRSRNEKRFDNTHLHRWMRKLRAEGKTPLLKILEVVTVATWVERERHWIAAYGLETLCNMNAGGFEPPDATGRIASEETRKKSSASRTGVTIWVDGKVHPMTGKAHPSKGIKRSADFCTKRRQYAITNNPMKRGYFSDAQVAMLKAMSEGNKKPIAQLDDQGTTIRIWEGAQKATKALGLAAGAVARVCKGEYQHTKGYRFSYVESEE